MGNEPFANNMGMVYPFFVIEIKADGLSSKNTLWAATNQCLGGSTSCINIVERLNHHLRNCMRVAIQPINSAAFSIAMSGTEARLYISWKDEEGYKMASVDNFLLHDPEQYLKFRNYVLNTIDWGRDKRLSEIRDCLDNLLEENRLRTSEAVKARQLPSVGSTTSANKKRKCSSPRSSVYER
jgi:hypothetical protein